MARTAGMQCFSKITKAKSPSDSFQEEMLVSESSDPTATTSLEEGLLARREAYGNVYRAILTKVRDIS